MFGYVQIRKPELKIRDYEMYHSFYCGLCHVLKERYGRIGQVTLTYDMTFLVMLLSSYCESEVEIRRSRCIMHPAKKHTERITEFSYYGADMNLLLCYFHFVDDLTDEKSIKAAGGLAATRTAYEKIRGRYPVQSRDIARALKKLHQIEKTSSGCDAGSKEDLLQEARSAASVFGQLMAALFRYNGVVSMQNSSGDQKCFQPFPAIPELQKMAYHLGCFIYLMDAYEDLREDLEKRRYNPLKALYNNNNAAYEDRIGALLFDEAAKTAAYFEKLPCLQYQDILRNILYAGIWNRYDKIIQTEGGKEADVSERPL